MYHQPIENADLQISDRQHLSQYGLVRAVQTTRP